MKSIELDFIYLYYADFELMAKVAKTGNSLNSQAFNLDTWAQFPLLNLCIQNVLLESY